MIVITESQGNTNHRKQMLIAQSCNLRLQRLNNYYTSVLKELPFSVLPAHERNELAEFRVICPS